MENEKSKNGIIGFLIGFIICLVIIVVLFATGTIEFNNDSKGSENKTTTTTEKSIKLVNSKDYVYDADYKYDGQQSTEYKRVREEGSQNTVVDDVLNFTLVRENHKLSDLKAPYININSDDAKKANDEIKGKYLEYLKEFDKCAEVADESSAPSCSLMFDYKVFNSNDVISVVIGHLIQSTSVPSAEYITYNFDIKTGKLLSYDDVLSKVGYTKDNSIEKIKNAIKENMDLKLSQYYGDLSTACSHSPLYSESPNCYEISYSAFNRFVSDNTLKYFVNADGKLGIMTVLYNEGQNGNRLYPIIVK